MAPVQRDTLVRHAYQIIRAAILEGKFAPGAKLVVRPIADELGLSPTPIKLALESLTREGIVNAVPRRGYFMPAFSRQDIKDIYAMRTALDRLAAELAAGQVDHTDLSRRLNENVKSQRAAIRARNLSLYADLNTEFHQAIWAASKNGPLIRASESIYGQIRILVNTSAGQPGRPGRSAHEHSAIVKALRAGDPSSAGELAAQHSRNSEEALLARAEPANGQSDR